MIASEETTAKRLERKISTHTYLPRAFELDLGHLVATADDPEALHPEAEKIHTLQEDTLRAEMTVPDHRPDVDQGHPTIVVSVALLPSALETIHLIDAPHLSRERDTRQIMVGTTEHVSQQEVAIEPDRVLRLDETHTTMTTIAADRLHHADLVQTP